MKKTIVLLLAVLVVAFSVPALAITLESVENAAEMTAVAENDGKLASSQVVPGINVLTGTALPATMDTAPLSVTGTKGTVTIEVPYTDGVNNVARWTCTSAAEEYPQWQFNVPLVVGRKYHFASNVKFTGTNSSFGHWINYSAGTAIGNLTSVKTSAWTAVKLDFESTKTQTFFAIQQKVKGASAETPAYFYYDDTMIVPYYKIQYIGLDGETTEATVDYLFDAFGNISDVYVPDLSLVEGATAYSLTADGPAVMCVPLDNNDVKLYARNDISVPEDTVCFTDAEKVYTVNATGDKFILPYNTTTGFTLGEGEYINLWYDGTNHYYPGDVLPASQVKGKVFKAIINDFSVWDETKGYLMFNVDYETGDVRASGGYINPRYKRTDHNSSHWATRTDGAKDNNTLYNDSSNIVHKDVAGTDTWHLAGHIYYLDRNIEDTKGAKATSEFDIKYIDGAAANYTGGNIRMCHDGAENYTNADISSQIKEKTDGVWYHIKATLETADDKVFQGGIPHILKKGVESTVYFDNFKAWVLPDTVAFFKSSRTAEDWVRFPVDKTVETYTMPTTVDAGFGEVENFLAWTDGKNLYEAGKAYPLATIEHKMFYPFTQDVTTPAVISLFEGNEDKAVSKTKLTEPVIDDGRTALMVAYWGDTWNAGNLIYDGDPRMSLTYPAKFDASKYTVIAAMTKVDHSYSAVDKKEQNGKIKANTTGSFQIFNYYNSNYNYNANSSIPIWSHDADGKYHYKEIDMATQSANAAYPWIDTGWGFAFDVIRATYGGRAFIDYVRVYKDGLNTVTYDTNAPAGVAKEDIGNVDAETGNVAPDTGRGLGTGYLLKDDRPVVPGHKFAGWALTPDAGVEDVIESFDFTEDTTVYAVWVPDNGAINARKTAEMRFRDTATGSIRFKADVTAAQVQDAVEYGFIVARKSHLDTYSEELTHSFIYRTQKTFTPLYVEGVAYQYDREADKVLVNKIYEKIESTGDVVYTALCTKIPLTGPGIKDKLVARPYYKYNLNGRVVYVYGTAHEASLGEVANAIDRNSSDYLNNKDYVDRILAEYVSAAE